MKKNKGFTLVEVLGVIVLLSIVFLISYTTILNTIKKSQDQIDQHTLSLITTAAKDYVSDNQDDFPEVNNNVFCIDINTLIDNNYIDEDTITVQGNSILSKIVQVTYKKDNKSEYEVVSECSKIVKYNLLYATDYLLDLTNDISVTAYETDSDESHQMYTFEHPATDQTEALTDYRYIGNTPYNYVDFNGEIWRIIGVFTVKNGNAKEQRIKLIRNLALSQTMYWNSNGRGNDWANATLNEYLNGEYYQGLDSEIKSMISPAETYLGAIQEYSTNGYKFGSGSDIYFYERGSLKSNQNFSINDTKNVTLMYPSDYIYTYANGVDDECYNNSEMCGMYDSYGWLWFPTYSYKCTVTPELSGRAISIGHSSYLGSDYTVRDWESVSTQYLSNATNSGCSVKPVVYLKASVKIASGNGTKDNPYKFKI